MTDKNKDQHLPQNADEQIARLQAQVAGNPECGTTYYNLAVAFIGKQEYAAAEKLLHDAIEHSPTLAEAYVLLGGICLQRNDLEGCYRYNNLATKSRAGFAEGYANMAFVLLQLIDGKNPSEDEDKLDKAIKNLRKAVVYNKNFIQAYTTLGNAYLMKDLVREAIEANLEAIRIAPDFPIAHNNLAIAYLEAGEIDKAIEHCDKAEALGYMASEGLKKELLQHRNP